MDWFTAERPVLRSLVDHAAATGFEDHAGQLAWTRWPFLHRQGHWLDWVATAEVALDAARQRADATAQARAHRSLSTAYLLLGRDTDAHAQLNDALELAVASGDRLAQAHAHVRMIYFWDRQGQPEQALDHARRGLELYQALGFEAGQGACLSQIGWCQALFGEYEQAVACCAEGLTLLQRVGDLEGQAATWDTLGYAHTHLGRTDEALSCYGHLGNRYDQAVSLTRLGDFRHGTGDTHAARAAWQQAMATFDELGHVDVGPVREKLRQLDKDAMARPATGASIVP
jgi:tetratricopeptide (TPR) repeat protein